MNHLWEVDHEYYCSETNFFDNDTCYKSGNWASFLEDMGDSDMDMNLLFRFDWKEEGYNDDPYYRNGTLQLFWVGQRKGTFWSSAVSVCRADEPAVMAFLEPRMDHLFKLWEPLYSPLRVGG